MTSFGPPPPRLASPTSPLRRTTRRTPPTLLRPRSPLKPSGSATSSSMRTPPTVPAPIPFPSSGVAAEPASVQASDPICTYLRLRPAQPANGTAPQPYLHVKSNTDIVMKPPNELNRPPQGYSFNKVFEPAAAGESSESQSHFFQQTCKPMIEGLLRDEQSGLFCTYGVSSSGKSYTVHGGHGAGEAGVLPRTLDTIFNSVGDSLSTRLIRPKGLDGVEEVVSEAEPPRGFDPLSLPTLQQKLGRATIGSANTLEFDHDSTTIEMDKKDKYSIWVSYLEVYNEKVYDLLDVADTPRNMSRSISSHWTYNRESSSTPRSNTVGTPGSVLTRHALPLQSDPDAGECKFAAGLSEHRVQSATEARNLIRRGEQNRAVFGTMANRVSSRSHGVFTVRVIREHQADQGTERRMYSTARMSIVDLAGSERMVTTQLKDLDRIKEAGNINKSLMNLGHCIEKIRSNQRLTIDERTKAEMVPYNSSKLTALLKHYFVGSGSTVMIVTANPFDGGFYENAQVMKFAANVRDVTRPRHNSAIPRSPSKVSTPAASRSFVPGREVRRPLLASTTGSQLPPSPSKHPLPSSPSKVQARFPSTASRPATSRPQAKGTPAAPTDEEEITVIEEGDDEEQVALVDLLIAKCEEFQQRAFAAEQRASVTEQRMLTLESEVRKEMADEMDLQLSAMRQLYETRLQQEYEMNQEFTNKKLEVLQHLQLSDARATHDHEPNTLISAPPSATQSPLTPKPKHRNLPSVVPDVHTPGDVFDQVATPAGPNDPRESFGGDYAIHPAHQQGTSARSSLTESFTSTANDERSVQNILAIPTHSTDWFVGAPGKELAPSQQHSPAGDKHKQGQTTSNSVRTEDASHSYPTIEPGATPTSSANTTEDARAQDDDDDSEESQSDGQDETFEPTQAEGSKTSVVSSASSKLRDAGTASQITEAAGQNLKRSASHSRSLSSSRSHSSSHSRSSSPTRSKKASAARGSNLSSARPTPAAIQAAASLTSSPLRHHHHRLERSESSSSLKSTKGKAMRKALGEAGSVVNRPTHNTHVDLSLSDASLFAKGSPTKKRVLRGSAVDTDSMAEQLA